MNERQLQDAVTDMCKLFGILWYHTHDSRGSNKGWPDLALCGSRLILRELKTETGKVTAEQEEWGAKLQKAGADWAVWRPTDLRSGRIQRELMEIR